MAEQTNAALVRDLYRDFRMKDGAILTALIAKEAVWHVPGATPISGDHRGRAAIFEYFRKMGELSAGTFHAELVDVPASESHAVAVATATGKRSGRAYDGSYLLIMRIAEGQVVDARLFNEDPAAFESFWS